MDSSKLVFVNAATKYGGHGMPKEEPDQERFERIVAAHLAESEVEGLTSICYDTVSLLVTSPEKALRATTRTFSATRGKPQSTLCPSLRGSGQGISYIYSFISNPRYRSSYRPIASENYVVDC